MALLAASVTDLGQPDFRLPSGAGHDAMVMAALCAHRDVVHPLRTGHQPQSRRARRSRRCARSRSWPCSASSIAWERVCLICPPDLFGEIDPPQRLLMGPGPVNAHPRVLRAMSADMLGQFDPEMTGYMEQVMALYRPIFGTANRWTLLVDGTARAGIEAALVSLVRRATACW
jgi:hypothetical protein